jgi:HlyD family secretion protein
MHVPTLPLIFCSLAVASGAIADTIASGTLLPKKDTQAVSFSPKGIADIYVLDVLPQGSKVTKGQSIATADFRAIDRQIEDTERAVKAKNLEVMRLRFDLEQQVSVSEQNNKESSTLLKRSEEDLKDFVEKRKARMIAEEEERVAKSLRQLSYKEEELKQLMKMYSDDQVAEETEEIILKRLKNELGESVFAVKGAKLIAELAKLRTINRLGEDLQTTIDKNSLNNKAVEAKSKFDVEAKQIALRDAEVALKRTQDSLNDLKNDRQLAQFKAPADGILLYGGYVGDKWVANSIATKLRPGGKLDQYDKIATIVPANSELIVQAVLPDSAATPKVGDQVLIRIANRQLPGSVAVADPIPDADGKRRIIINPQAPATEIFAPGLPVQVTLSDQPKQ